MQREDLKKYETDYTGLPFENILREYRQQNIFNILSTAPHKKILEIGSGPLPLFRDFNDYEKMVVVEPGETFFKQAKEARKPHGPKNEDTQKQQFKIRKPFEKKADSSKRNPLSQIDEHFESGATGHQLSPEQKLKIKFPKNTHTRMQNSRH